MAELLGVEPHVLRFWETEFSQISPSKSKTQQRLYKRDDVETIFLIRDLLYEQKFTIEGAKIKLRDLKSKAKEAKRVEQITLFESTDSIQRVNLAEAIHAPVDPKAVGTIKKIIQEMNDFLQN